MLISISPLFGNALTSLGQSVEFDGIMEVTPVHQNTVTKRPIEDGFDLSDAIHNEAIILNASIIITDNAQGILDKRNLTNLPSQFLPVSIFSQVKKQLNKLKNISDNKQVVSMKTKYAEYNDFFLENFTYTETPNTSIVINFTLSENRSNVQAEASTVNFSPDIGVWS